MMKKYNSYKETGIEWMGKIPKDWTLTKNRYGFLKYNNGKNESDDTSVLSLTIKGVKIKTNLNFGKSTESYIGHQLVEEGDIIFTPRDFDQTPILSDVSKYNGCISNLYIVDKTKKEVLNHFVNYYWYGLKYSVDYFKNFSHGIRYSFNRFQFDEIPLLIPPISEQKLIVLYLDKKITQIDLLIKKFQTKIELLKEQHLSLIYKFVTKGVEPKVEMKDSGIKWIGQIPKHWKIKKIKYLSTVKRGSSPRPIDDERYFDEEGEFSWVRIADVSASEKYLNNTKDTLSELGSSLSTKILPGDIFLSIAGSVGKPIITNIKCCIHDGFVWFENLKISKEFLYYIFYPKLCFQGLGKLGTQLNLNTDTVGEIKIPLPDEFEQSKIIKKLLPKLTNFYKFLELEKLRISNLKEYRKSLISSAVTGKVRITENMI
jgi:type I restriction enzyme, S subunit